MAEINEMSMIARWLHGFALSAAAIVIMMPFLPELLGIQVSAELTVVAFLVATAIFALAIVREGRQGS